MEIHSKFSYNNNKKEKKKNDCNRLQRLYRIFYSIIVPFNNVSAASLQLTHIHSDISTSEFIFCAGAISVLTRQLTCILCRVYDWKILSKIEPFQFQFENNWILLHFFHDFSPLPYFCLIHIKRERWTYAKRHAFRQIDLSHVHWIVNSIIYNISLGALLRLAYMTMQYASSNWLWSRSVMTIK